MSEFIKEAVQAYVDKQFEYKQFLVGVEVFFREHPSLNQKPLPVIHSVKSRLKDPQHLEGKLLRKLEKGIERVVLLN